MDKDLSQALGSVAYWRRKAPKNRNGYEQDGVVLGDEIERLKAGLENAQHINDNGAREIERLRASLEQVKYKAVSLADAQVIALEALADSAEQQCRMFCARKGGGPCLAEDCPRRASPETAGDGS